LSHRTDGTEFNANRAALWKTLRAEYPSRADPSVLKGEPLLETESPAAYIECQLRKWKQETQEDIEKVQVLKTLLRDSILEGMPDPV